MRLLSMSSAIRTPQAAMFRRAVRQAHSQFLCPLVPSSVVVRSTSEASPAAAGAATSSFSDLGLSPELLQALDEKGLSDPTEIQSAAVVELLRDRRSDFMLASHTGSGKTLAYLLPIVQALKENEAVHGAPTKPRRPKALVLGPTRELAQQIYGVAKSLAHTARFRSVLVTGGGEMGSQKAALDRTVDVLVGTPMRVAQHAQKGNVFYGDVEVVVLDEADTMLDRGFGPEVAAILKAVRSKPVPARCILVSATMTKHVRQLVSQDFPSLRTLETSSLHRGIAGARHTFLPIESGVNKLDVALQVVEGEAAKGHRVMVFCNTLDSCRAVDHHLREAGLATVCYHGDVPLEERKNAIVLFADPEADPPPLLVATDLAARGLDIPGRVDHVLNFDFPLNPVDYLHRTGRTARAGAKGRITSLVAKADRVLAGRVEEALAGGMPLDSLSSDKTVLPPHMRPKPETMQRKAVERKAEKHEQRGKRGAQYAARGSSAGGRSSVGRGGAAAGRGGRGGGASGRGRGGGASGPSRPAKTFSKFK